MARTRVLMASFRVAMWMTFVAVAGYGQETAIEGKLDRILQQLTQLKEENQKLNQEMQDLRREVRDLRSAKTSEPVPENEQLEVLNQRVEDLDTGKVSAATARLIADAACRANSHGQYQPELGGSQLDIRAGQAHSVASQSRFAFATRRPAIGQQRESLALAAASTL